MVAKRYVQPNVVTASQPSKNLLETSSCCPPKNHVWRFFVISQALLHRSIDQFSCRQDASLKLDIESFWACTARTIGTRESSEAIPVRNSWQDVMAVSPVHGLAAGQSSNVSIQVSCSSAVYYSNRFNAVLCQSALAFLPVPTTRMHRSSKISLLAGCGAPYIASRFTSPTQKQTKTKSKHVYIWAFFSRSVANFFL